MPSYPRVTQNSVPTMSAAAWLLAVLLALLTSSAVAHEVRPGYLELREIAAATFILS